MSTTNETFESYLNEKSAAEMPPLDPDAMDEQTRTLNDLYFKYQMDQEKKGEPALGFNEWDATLGPDLGNLNDMSGASISEEDATTMNDYMAQKEKDAPIDSMLADGSISDEEAQNWDMTAPEGEKIPGIKNKDLGTGPSLGAAFGMMDPEGLDAYLAGKTENKDLDKYLMQTANLPEIGSREFRELPQALRSAMVDKRDDKAGLLSAFAEDEQGNPLKDDAYKHPLAPASVPSRQPYDAIDMGNMGNEAARAKQVASSLPGGADGDPSTPWYKDWKYLVPGALGVGGLAALGTNYMMGDDEDEEKKKNKKDEEAYA